MSYSRIPKALTAFVLVGGLLLVEQERDYFLHDLEQTAVLSGPTQFSRITLATSVERTGAATIRSSRLCLMILSLAVSLYLASVENQSNEAKRLIGTCSTTWNLGFEAIVGLIGGKALQR